MLQLTIAEVNTRYAIAIVASEQVPEASSAFRLAIARRFITAIQTIIIAVAVPVRELVMFHFMMISIFRAVNMLPCGRDASMVRASEAVHRASPLGAMSRIFIAVVTTIIVTVTEEIGLGAYVGSFALEVVRRARDVVRTAFVSLVGSDVILAVVDAIANLGHWDAALIGASEFPTRASWVDTAFLVASVATVVL